MDGNNAAKILLIEDNTGDARLVAEEMKDAVADMSFFKLNSECTGRRFIMKTFPHSPFSKSFCFVP